MKFFAVAAVLAAAVSAESICSVVTVTETVTAGYGHTPSAPGTVAPTGPAPYPTSAAEAAVPSVAPSGTGAAIPPAGTAAPSGTGAYSPPSPEFTGAAGAVQVGGMLAGVGAVAAFFL
ncbi:hypothetical protein BS50DRAFT_154883 [Corynespora cassiicola Philippines]|uniref:Uncharacterized protein n=1 Tax=Corynespora cassiicola Philippines TaxID=1448308 RepID=A0A2T2N6S8_CORCC|nr:hypothetical protein BS50DRAFT_154883 [Corynespora cassiicola Philippines]